MGNRQVYKKVDEFIDKVIPEYNPEKIILYGSYAKGKSNENSLSIPTHDIIK